jgi:hypothetical protein
LTYENNKKTKPKENKNKARQNTPTIPDPFGASYFCSGLQLKYLCRCQTTNSPIRAWNIYESSPFSKKSSFHFVVL